MLLLSQSRKRLRYFLSFQLKSRNLSWGWVTKNVFYCAFWGHTCSLGNLRSFNFFLYVVHHHCDMLVNFTQILFFSQKTSEISFKQVHPYCALQYVSLNFCSYVRHITSPKEFGSMTARKEQYIANKIDKLPEKTIKGP